MAMSTLENCSKPSLADEKWDILFTNIFPLMCMYYRTFLEWFLIAFLQSIYGHVSIDKKRKKNIAIIINARNSSSDFYFGLFVGGWRHSTKLYPNPFFTKSNTGLF